ncbi:hypothetical protein SBBP2_470017 [Burkholderiales bacterium]|nr:hypothetical protein SBBP2_470017 [Burkholderiales bacterium]
MVWRMAGARPRMRRHTARGPGFGGVPEQDIASFPRMGALAAGRERAGRTRCDPRWDTGGG